MDDLVKRLLDHDINAGAPLGLREAAADEITRLRREVWRLDKELSVKRDDCYAAEKTMCDLRAEQVSALSWRDYADKLTREVAEARELLEYFRKYDYSSPTETFKENALAWLSRTASLVEDGPCQACGGKGCKHCSAATAPEDSEGKT